MRFRSSVVLAALLLAAISGIASAAGAAEPPVPRMVVDLDPGVEPFESSGTPDLFSSYTPVNGRLVFLAFLQHGAFERNVQCGLWATDGTAGSTERLAEFCGEVADLQGSRLRVVASTGFVTLLADAAGKLWRTDGTAAGTYPLADVLVDGIGARDAFFGPDGRTVFFRGCTPAAGCELWGSDGTREGTALIRDLRPGSESSSPGLFTFHDLRRVLFAARGGNGTALWATDGTAGGTVKVFSTRGAIPQVLAQGAATYWTAAAGDREEVWALPAGARKGVRLTTFRFGFRTGVTLYEAGSRVLMVPFDDEGLLGLWTTDGTRAGTRPLVPRSQFKAVFNQFAAVGTRTLFGASTEAGNFPRVDLWYLDAGMKHPRRLLGCPDGCPRLDPNVTTAFASFRGRVFFAGGDPAHGIELWSTDGTPAGTRLVKDLCPGPCDSAPQGLHPTRDGLLFADERLDLWTTDGTAAGTVRLAHLPFPPPDGVPVDLAEFGTRVVFTGLDANGPQPWVSDLTPGGTGPIRRIGDTLAASGRIVGLASLGGQVLFAGCDGAESAVWSSDGTAAGTVLLPGTQEPCQLYPYATFHRLGSFALFAFPFTGSGHGKLWRTDGTAAGTRDLLDLHASLLLNAAPARGKLLFRLDPVPQPFEPLWHFWTSDGTPQGTQPAFQLPLFGDGYLLAPAGDDLLFSGHDPDPPFASWLRITDGTEAGTRRLLELQADPAGATLTTARLGDRIFFIVSGAERNVGFELWSTDGTTAGTAPVIPDASAPRPVFDPVSLSLVAFQDALYFFASTGDPHHQGLWRSDGTAAGTRLIRALDPPTGIYSGTRYFLSPLLTPAGNQLFFRADDGVHGVELWKSDGTPEGTALVADVAPGRAHARIAGLTAAGDKLYFVATDGEHGRELWESDGTASGTRMVADILPGPPSSSPEQITAADGKLFFTATDGEHGRELWMLPLTP